MKPPRKALEKIWTILQEIEVKRNITLAGDDISIPQILHWSKARNSREADATADERFNILRKLENEENAIKDVRWPNDHNKLVYLKIGEKYFDTFSKYEEAYKKSADEYEQEKQVQETQVENPIYEIRYSEQTREILINSFLLKKLRSFSDNDATFAYLYKNPNQDKTGEDIQEGTGLKSLKNLNKFLDDLGFTGDLRKVFFKVSKNRIRFNNPITKDYLEEIGIERLTLK